MDKIDRIISIIRNLREEMTGMTTNSSGSIAGFSQKSPDQGPTAGYDKFLFDGRSKIARRLPPPYKAAIINSKKKRK